MTHYPSSVKSGQGGRWGSQRMDASLHNFQWEYILILCDTCNIIILTLCISFLLFSLITNEHSYIINMLLLLCTTQHLMFHFNLLLLISSAVSGSGALGSGFYGNTLVGLTGIHCLHFNATIWKFYVSDTKTCVNLFRSNDSPAYNFQHIFYFKI